MPRPSDDGESPAPDARQAAAGLPGLLAVDHVGLAVPDLDAAIAFHTDVLGLVLLHREHNAEAEVEEAMLRPGPEVGGTQVQLLAPTSPASPIGRFLERSGPGLQQLAYRVADVEKAASVLRSRGLRLLYDQAKPGTRGSRINFVHPHDAGGVLIELVEPALPPAQPDGAVGPPADGVVAPPHPARCEGGTERTHP